MNMLLKTLLTLLPVACTPLLAQKATQGAATPRPAQTSQAPSGSMGRAPGARNTPAGFAVVQRPATMPPPLTNRILWPRALPQCRVYPNQAYWPTRDILKEIQYMSRRGFIPVTPGLDAAEISGVSFFPEGWRAYGFVVPGKEKLHVRLHHPNEGWFRLIMVDRWGLLREGMLQNLIPTGNPEVSYLNPSDQTNTVYVIVDDPGWMSTEGNPFLLKVDRTWDPAKTKAPTLPPVHGIWAEAKPAPTGAKPVPADAKPDPVAAKTPAAS